MQAMQQSDQARGALREHVVCEVDGSTEAERTVEAAVSYCRGRHAELVFVYVLEPRLFHSPLPGSCGAVGTWGLPWTLRRAIEIARAAGIPASTVVRIGERERVLAAEAEAVRAEAVFPAAHRVVRCPRCDARYDRRAIHLCPEVHMPRRSAASRTSPAASIRAPA